MTKESLVTTNVKFKAEFPQFLTLAVSVSLAMSGQKGTTLKGTAWKSH
jgi:hypothetical protein